MTCVIPLIPEDSRLTVYPVPKQREHLYQLCRKQEAMYWQAHEVELSSDIASFNTLNGDQQHLVKMIIAFFAGADALVGNNLVERFILEIPIPEVRRLLTFQAMMELSVHADMYGRLVNTYIQDMEERLQLFNAISRIPSIKKKAAWVQHYSQADLPLAERLLAFVWVEGGQFQSSFAFIYFLRELGVLLGLSKSNDLISRDEAFHTNTGITLLQMIPAEQRPSQQLAHTMFSRGVQIEKEFIYQCLKRVPDEHSLCSLEEYKSYEDRQLPGMKAELMAEYIEFVANIWLVKAGYQPLYPKAKNPFPFMDLLTLDNKSDFFVLQPSEYNMSVNVRMTEPQFVEDF